MSLEWCIYHERTTSVTSSTNFYWPKMKEDAKHFICTCVKCQNTKSWHMKKLGLYRPYPILTCPYEGVSMNFMTCLLEWQEKDAILAVINKISKLAKFGPIETIAMMMEITKLFLSMWVKHNGMLNIIINGHDENSILEFWTFLMKRS